MYTVYGTDNLMDALPTNTYQKRIIDKLELQTCATAANGILSDDLIAVYCAQYLGQILVEGGGKAVVSRPSNETKSPGSFIVLEKDPTGVYTLQRLFIDKNGNVQQEMVFMTSQFFSITDVYLFNEYALVLVNENSFHVIYFNHYRGKEVKVPSEYGVLFFKEDAIVGQTLYMSRDSDDPPELFVAVRSAGTIKVKRIRILIDPKN